MQIMGEFAGFFAAHAVWCVAEGETLVPLLAFQRPDGSREMLRFATEGLEEGVARGRQWLADNPENATHAVLIFDGYLTQERGQTDALLLEAAQSGAERSGFAMAIPYRSKHDPAGFAVSMPRFLDSYGAEPDTNLLSTAFFRGVERHTHGAAIWKAHLAEENP